MTTKYSFGFLICYSFSPSSCVHKKITFRKLPQRQIYRSYGSYGCSWCAWLHLSLSKFFNATVHNWFLLWLLIDILLSVWNPRQTPHIGTCYCIGMWKAIGYLVKPCTHGCTTFMSLLFPVHATCSEKNGIQQYLVDLLWIFHSSLLDDLISIKFVRTFWEQNHRSDYLLCWANI